MFSAGPGENEPASWTHSKENLSAEDIDRPLVAVDMYLEVSLVRWTGVYIYSRCK